jgi:hypothetical protein
MEVRVPFERKSGKVFSDHPERQPEKGGAVSDVVAQELP